jgi:hypothetical protein
LPAKDPRIVQVMAGLAADTWSWSRCADGTATADVRPMVRLSA